MAIESVLNQKYSDWELVILDNGSNDSSTEILVDYQKCDSRISCIYRENNVGWPKGISLCLERANGEFMMFLGADDYLANEQTLQEVAGEIFRHRPDIVWTGCSYAVWEEDTYQIVTERIPSYKVYETEDKLTQVAEIMDNVHYNSVMHYVNINFLRQNGIDFFQPFYGDCQGMTEALCKARKMVTLNKAEYVLTANTSKTAPRVGFDYNVERQWRSVKSVLSSEEFCNEDRMEFVAERILRNLAAIFESVVLGEPLRDEFMSDVEKDLSERFEIAEHWLSSDSFGEMMFYAGREKFAEQLIGAVGVMYWECKRCSDMIDRVREKSKWLAELAEKVFKRDTNGMLKWKEKISEEDAKFLKSAILNSSNKHRIGCELLLKDGIIYEKESLKEQFQNIWREYIDQMERGRK